MMVGNLKSKPIEIPNTAQPPFLLANINQSPELLLYAPPPPTKTEQPKKKFTFKSAPPAPTSESVHLFSIAEHTWRVQQTKGKFPSRRQHASSACLGPCLMVYGGRQLQPDKLLNDLYCLNLQTWQWKKLFTMQAPKPEDKVFLCSFGDQLFLFGSQCWSFNAKGVTWQAESADLPGGVWQKLNLEMAIRPLAGYVEGDRLILFGRRETSAVIQAISLECEEGNAKVSQLTLSRQIENKVESCQVCSTTGGKGLLVDKTIFIAFSFDVPTQTINIGPPILSEQPWEQLVPSTSTNYTIQGKHLTQIRIEVQHEEPPRQEESEEESEQQTARQIIRQQLQPNRSIEQRQSFQESSARAMHSPLSQRQTAPIINRLKPLLAKQYFRRRILEQKSLLLESTINKAQKMVLALCKYGEESEKQRHIGKVCKLREQLCKVHQSEHFLRTQMEERPGENELRARAVKETFGVERYEL